MHNLKIQINAWSRKKTLKSDQDEGRTSKIGEKTSEAAYKLIS